MRILHTSDWHLGQNFIGRSRAAEHQAFLTWLVQQVVSLQIDAVLVAGDIFDTATPPSYARELYNQFIVSLQDTGCQLIVLGGNHDAPAVLNESKNLLRFLRTDVIANSSADLTAQLLILRDTRQQPGAIVCAIPFLRARDLLQSQAGQSAQEKQRDLQQAIASHYQQLFQLAQQYNQQQQLALPIIMTGHLTTLGVSQSESVRDIYIGTLEAFAADAFPAADYIALGHIHQSQQIKGDTDIRYSGSPIALSFDEAKQQKQAWLVQFEQGAKTVTSVPIPCFQALSSIKTDLATLQQQVSAALAAQQVPGKLWLELVISDKDAYLSDLQSRVEQQLQDLPVELLRLRRQRSSSETPLTMQHTSLAELSPQDVWQARLAKAGLSEQQQQQLSALHQQVVAKLEDIP